MSINFVLQTPSFQHLALVKITAHLWNQPDILTQIARPFRRTFKVPKEQWVVIENEVKAKVSALPLPELCKNLLLNLIEAMGTEVETWCRSHNVNKYLYVKHLLPNNRLCWSLHGTVDYAKTAERMLRNESLDMECRYAVACLNCLEDEARDLFYRMGEVRRRELVEKLIADVYSMKPKDMITYFTFTIYGNMDRLNRYFKTNSVPSESIHRRLFRVSLRSGNRATCEYFFPKLSQREKAAFLEEFRTSRFQQGDYPAGGLVYYWSRANEEQQSRMFPKCMREVLKCMLRWPMQPLFMETVKCGLEFLNRYTYGDVLNEILHRICLSYPDYEYSQLFWEYWGLGPTVYKQYFLNDFYNMACLFSTKREEFIRLIFNQAPPQQLKYLIERMQGGINPMLKDDSIISDAALAEYKETAALESSNAKDDVRKRLRSKYVSQLVDIVMEHRIKRQRL